jgi:uncharacterized protein
MKLLFIKYLLFSVLMSATIMSVHAYAHSLDCASSEEQQLSGDMDNQNDLQKASCDHCCHFSSHSVGLHKSDNADPFIARNGILNTDYRTYRSLKAGPPYHPPILV